jgi:DNA-binding transcriptional MerR regulator
MPHTVRPADTFSLTDLARLADVTPRTIRYYISQGLLAAPTGSGHAARYGGGHLARLRLVRRLQREHLPLAEIRSRLGRLSDDELDALADETTGDAAPPPSDSATDYIRRVLAGAPSAAPAAPAMLLRTSAHMASEAAPPLAVPAPPPPPPAADAEPDRSTWERVALTPDVELHLRRPLDRQTNKRVDRLIRIARELLEED